MKRKLKVTGLVLACGLAILVASQWPEIQRYIKMERM
jgi:hypothetical protein